MRPKKANTNGHELIVSPHLVRGLLTDAELIPGANPGVSRPVGLPGTSGHAGMIGASDREAGLNHAAQSSDRCSPRFAWFRHGLGTNGTSPRCPGAVTSG